VCLFQHFATLDLLSEGRAKMVVRRGSLIEAFPLFGYELNDYDAPFAESWPPAHRMGRYPNGWVQVPKYGRDPGG
jgi:alkanesulfonate monooxygenase SsuD/methylene tetrahydromethanopterin reductase-like flavin-dependent oxidoreductase (luciferase family)